MRPRSLFDDPDRDERALYAKYWQNKLKSNKEIDFPDALVDEVAEMTAKFSFAYLKEALCACIHLSLSRPNFMAACHAW